MRSNRQKGFTLIELLVVIGIMATMAAIAVPAVSRFIAPAEVAADDEEFGRVQAAMDTYIAENNLPPPFVAANSVAANDFSASNPILFPGYIRESNTHCRYTWDANGRMTQDTCP